MKQSIDSFFESIRGKRIALIGMGRSHMPLIPFLRRTLPRRSRRRHRAAHPRYAVLV